MLRPMAIEAADLILLIKKKKLSILISWSEEIVRWLL